jgi:serine protease Do
VRAVQEGSPAESAGLTRGDLIVRAGDTDIDSVDALYAALDAVAEGGVLTLRVLRGTEEVDVRVRFGEGVEEV